MDAEPMIWWLTAAGRIAHGLVEAQAARRDAKTEQERIAADVRIAQLQARRDALVAGGKVVHWVQALWAAPFIIYVWKLIVWDKVLVSLIPWLPGGRTDPLGVYEGQIGMIVVGFYFLTQAVTHFRR